MSATKEFYHDDIMRGLIEDKYATNSYSVLAFIDRKYTHLNGPFKTHQEALNKCKELNLTKYVIENSHYE